MGYIRHNAIVVTSWDTDILRAAAERATELDLEVLGPSKPAINHYASLLICPDGSKEGWDASTEFDKRRDQFEAWLRSRRCEDDSSHFEWVEVAYGADDSAAEIVTSEWEE